ncbi:ABC transporter substrate-binding protein [Cohnella cholangitidis]|uniref:Iron-siderophore ABC transporter substrate-binding protein n=1 Tax=Cohnella cholangitidis TaxID=2598458 RepID=A0A7G5BWR8_9BACL|nr:iron-siderophore ABC transporter substrate-binding protein [Cohnella cholangitidis]QMV41402.1 iron-siderophore ABC transporter substrate-binding protein [Cohnella cholangitidis]
MKANARKQSAWWGIVLLVMAMMVTACGNNKGNGNESSSPAASNSASPAAETASPEGSSPAAERVIKHAMGETKISGAPQRVVVLTNEGTEALLALGVKPVGAVKSWTGSPWYDHIKDQMEGVTELGEEGQPNLELIAGLKPDLILGNKMRHEKIYEQLSAIAPTVESETLRGEWKTNFKLYAEALGKTAEGDKLIADFDAKIDQFKTKAGDKLKETVSVVRFMGGKTRVYHTDTFTGVIFNQIGITRNAMTLNAKDQFVDEITKERLPEADADRLLYFTYETGDGKASETEKEWVNDSLWQSLNAVKNGKVYKVDDAVWNTAGGILAANLVIDGLYEIYEVK